MPRILEFGIFVRGCLDNDMNFILSDSFYVPEQEVTSVTIDFKEHIDKSAFNGVIHRHPSNCTAFSGTDDVSINSNFEFSLLYVNNSIQKGILNLELRDHLRIQLPLEVKIVYPIDNNIHQYLEKIKEKQEVVIPDSEWGKYKYKLGDEISSSSDTDKVDFSEIFSDHYEEDDDLCV
jgi:hypothetical protein